MPSLADPAPRPNTEVAPRTADWAAAEADDPLERVAALLLLAIFEFTFGLSLGWFIWA